MTDSEISFVTGQESFNTYILRKETELKKENTSLPRGISLRADGRYQGRLTYQGKRYALYGKTTKELQKKMQDLKYELEHGIYVKEEELTIEIWFNTWLTVYKINSVKDGTIDTYKRCFKQYIRPAFGIIKLKDIRAEQIQKFYNDLKAKGYASSTIDLVAIILNSMFKQAAKNEIIKKNPVELTTRPKDHKRHEKEVLSVEEQNEFIRYAENSKYENVYKIALFTGMRVGELRSLEWKNVDFIHKVINVHSTLKYSKEKGYYKDTPKTLSSDRSIPMLEGVYKCIKEQKRKQAENKIRHVNIYHGVEGLEDLVFTTDTGMPISYDALNVDMKKITKNINEDGIALNRKKPEIIFPHISPHTLRHVFATRGLENGITPKVMQEILGHSSITMTLDLYSHVLPDFKAEEMKKLESLL